jgi:hypothetical protein
MFERTRFLRLARAQFAEQWRGWAWFLAGVLLIGVVVAIHLAISGLRAFGTQDQEGYFYAGLFLFAPIFAGRYFLAMSSRASALLSLMRPASVFEKWLLAVLVVVALWPLAYTLVFYLVDVPCAAIAYVQAKQFAAQAALEYAKNPIAGGKPAAFQPELYRLFLPWSGWESWRDPVQMGLWLLFAQGFAMFGSLYFRSVPFIKTLFSALLLGLVVALCAAMFDGNPELFLGYWDRRRPLADWQHLLYPAVWFLAPAAFWLACYLGLREREITA